jgi:replicative DNA helicase
LNFQENILAALIPRTQAEKPLVTQAFQELARARVPSEYFTGNYKILFDYVVKQNGHNTVLDRDILEARLSQETFSDEEKNELRILYSTCKEQIVPIDKFKELVPAFVEECGKINFGNALRTSTQILTEGARDGQKQLKGLADAKRYLMNKVSGVQLGFDDFFPEDNVFQSMDKLWEQYNAVELNPSYGIKTGEKEIDLLTGGILPGELWVNAAFAKEGKSQRLKNWAYYASVIEKRNTVYFSLETSFDQLNRQFVSLHSCNPKFGNPFGIEEEKIAFGKLSSTEKTRLKEITDDFNSIDKGILHLVQLPYESTVLTIRDKLLYLNSLWPVDIVYLDYASLLKPIFYKNSTVTETTQIFNMLKQLALTFNNGKGIPMVTCHQISRQARTEAEKSETQRYGIGALSDAAGVERAADFVTWLLRTDEMIDRSEVKCGVYYTRRTKLRPDWMLMERYECSKLNSMEPEIVMTGDIHLID